MKQSSKLKKHQGYTFRGLSPGGTTQARGWRITYLIKGMVRMSADPTSGSLLPCQDPCRRLSPQSPNSCTFNTARGPCQSSRLLRPKKAKWRFGNAHPEGCRRTKKEQAYCPCATRSLRLVPSSPQGEQGALDLIFLKKQINWFLLKNKTTGLLRSFQLVLMWLFAGMLESGTWCWGLDD